MDAEDFGVPQRNGLFGSFPSPSIHVGVPRLLSELASSVYVDLPSIFFVLIFATTQTTCIVGNSISILTGDRVSLSIAL